MAFDFLIVGGGIMGLALARELRKRNPKSSILILEKEDALGRHASGRNSGVLHSGIFYGEDSTKAKVCAAGARAMEEFCRERALPIEKTGKVILPVREGEEEALSRLYDKGRRLGINAALVDANELKKIEPAAFSITGKALHLPDVCVVEPVEILNRIAKELVESGVEIRFGAAVEKILPEEKCAVAEGEKIGFGHLFNAAGLHAEKVAHDFGIGRAYTIVPFKGLYFKISPDAGLKINGLIYALPDPRVPFLGIHYMKRINGDIYAGPTIVPVFGRENYHGLQGVHPVEACAIFGKLFQLYLANHGGFRNLVLLEGPRFLKPFFYERAHRLVPELKQSHMLKSEKAGIRAQLVNVRTRELTMDFVVENGPASTHILNAVSPAFTSSFAFAKMVLDQAGIR